MATLTKTDQKLPLGSLARYNTGGHNPLEPGKSYVNRGGFEYVINSMFVFAIIGMCIKIFFGKATSSDGLYGPANTIIYGYGIVALAILTVMFISFAVHDRIGRIENKGKVESIVKFLKSFLTSSAPSLLTIIVLLWIITLNITYYTRINKGMVATEYYQLSAGTSFLFVFQIACLFQYLRLFIKMKTDPNNAGKDAVSTQNRIAFATYFLTAINLIVVGMMNIILQFFSTDG
jgi:hypothetical protein